jgi:hypothetical protein
LTHSQQQQANAAATGDEESQFAKVLLMLKEGKGDLELLKQELGKLQTHELIAMYALMCQVESNHRQTQDTPSQQPQSNAAKVLTFTKGTDLVPKCDEVDQLPTILEGGQPGGQPVVNRDWLSLQQVVDLLGISKQAVSKNIAKGKYLTRQVESKSGGGVGGLRYEIAAESLPEPFKTQWYDACPIAPVEVGQVLQPFSLNGIKNDDPNFEQRIKKALWIEERIKPIVTGTPAYSAARGKAVKELKEQLNVDWLNRQTTFTTVTIYNWIKAYEKAGGILGLMPKERTDRDQKRILISRVWDQAFIGLIASEDCQQISEELTTYIASLWAAGATGRNSIRLLAIKRLQELTAAKLGVPVQAEYCDIGDRTITDIGEKYRILALKDKDSKYYNDHINPRLIRDWSNYLPNDIWIGDVRPLDVRLLRTDGREVYPRTISWYDVATHIRIDVIIQCEPGEGVKQTHVALAFIAAVTHLGLPKKLYLDNGSEYQFTEMLEAFNELNRLGYKVGVELGLPSGFGETDMDQTVIRALPYNASAKSIEGSFAVWARVYEPNIQGYVGGDRTKKLRSKLGGQPHTFNGSLDDLHTQMSILLNSYHKRPQSGHLKGRSPIEAFNDYVKQGWQAIGVDQTALALAMSEKDVRVVQAGGIIMYKPKDFPKYENIFYHNPEFADVATKRVSIRVLRHDPSYIFAHHPQTGWKVCALYQPSDALSRDGIEILRDARRHLKRVISEKRGQVYALNLVDEWEDWNQTQPDFLPTPFAATIEGGKDIQAMKQEMEVKANAILEAVAVPTQQRISSRWQTDHEGPRVVYADE